MMVRICDYYQVIICHKKSTIILFDPSAVKNAYRDYLIASTEKRRFLEILWNSPRIKV